MPGCRPAKLGVATLLALSLLLAGCGFERHAASDTSKVAALPADWRTFESKKYGISFRLPPGWKEEGQTDSVNADPEAEKAAEKIGEIKVAVSAVSPVKASADSFPDTITALYVAQKDGPTIDDKYASDTLAELRSDYPKGDAHVELIKIPAGTALRAVYKDEGTLGLSGKEPSGQGKVIEVTNVQTRVTQGRALYLIQVTGSTQDSAALVELSDKVAQSLTLR